MPNPDEIKRRFRYNPPNERTIPLHERVNALTEGLANTLDELLPEGREKALALTAVQEVRLWANCAVATCLPKEPTG